MNESPPLNAVIIDAEGEHKATVIWLHGLGADGHDFAPITTELQLPASLGVRFVLPHAPKRPVTINGGFVMRAWYDIASKELETEPDLIGIEASRESVLNLIRDEAKRGISPPKIILAGFSQGGVIALETATQHEELLGGVIALSCYAAFPKTYSPSKTRLPIFMAHGTDDNIVPISLGRLGKTVLEGLDFALDWHEYPMPHSVCGQEITDLRKWLLERLS